MTQEKAHFEEIKDHSLKSSLGKFDYDLFHDEKNVVEKIIRVKKVGATNSKWKIYENDKVMMTITESSITKEAKSFLSTIEGFRFLISTYKTEPENLLNLVNLIK